MLKFDFNDEGLQSAVNNFISALLPHEFYEPELFTDVLNTIFKYIRLNEFELEYRLLLEALYNLGKIKISVAMYSPVLTREIFLSILEAGVNDAIVNPELGVEDWLKYEGMKSDLTIALVREEACQKLCTRALDLYDTCFELGIATETVLNYEPELKEAFIANISKNSLNVQANIIRHEVRIGRIKYHGYADWLKYTTSLAADLNDRLSEARRESRVILDNVESSKKLLGSLAEFFMPIAEYGIPPIDDFTPILRHRLVVIVGKENIGKTKFAVDQAVNIILSGHKVAYMCGETQPAAVYADILINYIWKKFNIVVRAEHLYNTEDCPDDVRKAIGMAIDDVVTSGSLILCDAFNYATVFEQMQALYEETHCDAIIIDHSCALAGTAGDGSLKAKVDKLSQAAVDFKKAYPVCVMITSHPSTVAKDSDSRGKVTSDSATKGSQDLSTNADEVFYLRDTEALRKQNQIMIENIKRRNARRISDYIILRKNFAVSAFIYDENEQASSNQEDYEQAKTIELMEATYNNGENEEDYTIQQ